MNAEATLTEMRYRAAQESAEVEHFDPFGNGFGFLIRWEAPLQHVAEFTVWEIDALAPDEPIVNPEDVAVRGSVKFDGCGHVYFGDDEGYRHICGERDFEGHAKLLMHLFTRSRERILAAGGAPC